MTELERVLTAWVDALVVEDLDDGLTMRYVRLPTPAEEAAREWALHQAIAVVERAETLVQVMIARAHRPGAFAGVPESLLAQLEALLTAKPPS